MRKLNALFISNGGVGIPTLEAMNASEAVSSLRVITNGKPDGLTARKADELRVRCDYCDRNKANLGELVDATAFDVALVLSFGHIFDEQTLKDHQGKFFNTHFSALPKWRGAAPVERAILAGEEEFGVTIQEMVRRVDAGRIVAQRRFQLGQETAQKVYATLAEAAGDMTQPFLSTVKRGRIPYAEQDETEVTKAPKIDKSELFVSADDSRETVWRKYRALGCRGLSIPSNKGMVKIKEMSDEPCADGFEVRFPGGSLWLKKLVIANKKPIAGNDVRNGYPDLDFTGADKAA